jgi:hypothetical protein
MIENNKIPQEIEEKNSQLEGEGGAHTSNTADNHNWIDEKDCFNTGFDKGFKKGQKQKSDDVLKLIDEFFSKLEKRKQKYWSFGGIKEELKSKLTGYETREPKKNFVSGGENGKED